VPLAPARRHHVFIFLRVRFTSLLRGVTPHNSYKVTRFSRHRHADVTSKLRSNYGTSCSDSNARS
jgi:hypothetical protein